MNNNMIQNQASYDPYAYQGKIKVDVHQMKAFIDVDKSRELIQQKNDLTAAGELQQTKVSIRPSGETFVERDTFHGTISTPLPIKVKENILYSPLNQEDEGWVLKLVVCDSNSPKQKTSLWLAQTLIVERNIKTLFQRAGISFGFGTKKETEIRQKFVTAAINTANTQTIPVEHGWYKCNDDFFYAYPDELVWKEAYRNAQRCLL